MYIDVYIIIDAIMLLCTCIDRIHIITIINISKKFFTNNMKINVDFLIFFFIYKKKTCLKCIFYNIFQNHQD